MSIFINIDIYFLFPAFFRTKGADKNVTKLSILSSPGADSRATHPASSKLSKNVEEAPLSRGEFRCSPSEPASRELARLIPLSRGGAAPR